MAQTTRKDLFLNTRQKRRASRHYTPRLDLLQSYGIFLAHGTLKKKGGDIKKNSNCTQTQKPLHIGAVFICNLNGWKGISLCRHMIYQSNHCCHVCDHCRHRRIHHHCDCRLCCCRRRSHRDYHHRHRSHRDLLEELLV